MTRLLTDQETESLRVELTKALRSENGTMMLEPTQAKALWSFSQAKGLVLYGRVGCGKTLLAMLIPVLAEKLGWEFERPLLIGPSGLVKKTYEEFAEYSCHWQFLRRLRVEGYSMLSDRKHADFLEHYRPDLLIFDEAHALSNIGGKGTRGSGRAVRVDRYITGTRPDGTQVEPPDCTVVCMTGSWERDSFLDYSHMLVWALKHKCPTPLTRSRQAVIASVVDPDGNAENLLKLRRMMPEVFGRCYTVNQAREALKHLLHHTPGVVITTDLFQESSLQVSPIVAEYDDEIVTALQVLRDQQEMPDGWALADSEGQGGELGAYQAARQLSTGFYYALDPRPPKEWLAARRAWAKAARILIESGRGDTEAQVRDLVVERKLEPYYSKWRQWEATKPTFVPNRKVEWISDVVLKQAEAWAREHGAGSIVWVEHNEFGRELSRRTGFTFYGQKGLADDSHERIDDDPGRYPVIASLHSNKEGRNLQHSFHRGLVIGVPGSGRDWEQLLGRKHRKGQKKQLVQYEYLVACLEHVRSIERAAQLAATNEANSDMPMKLNHCDLTMPPRKLPDTPAFRKGELVIQDTDTEEGNHGRLCQTTQQQGQYFGLSQGRAQSQGRKRALPE